MKVLIVDDERAIRNSLGEILTDEGYGATSAAIFNTIFANKFCEACHWKLAACVKRF